MNDFKEKILEGIKKGEIKAESRWQFLAHDYFFWSLTGASTVLGSLAVSSVLHRIAVDQAPLAPHMRSLEAIPVFLQTIPYLWIVVLFVLGAAAWFNFNKTSRAYKHQLIVLLSMLVVTMLMGGILFAGGVGGVVDTEMRKRVPAFEKQRIKRQEIRNQFLQKRGDKTLRIQNRNAQPYPIASPQRFR